MSPTSFYLPSGGRATLHSVGGAAAVGVLLVPPFGLEDTASYRGRRGWADTLASHGYPCLRLELPGTGDAAGAWDDTALFGRWLDAVAEAAAALRAAGCARVTAVGMGLGGMLATVVAADGDSIDDLALWAVPATGRALLRELRAFASAQVTVPPGPYDDGSLWFYGYALSAQTVADLGAVDLTTFDLGRPGRRVLVLGRDRLPPDARLLAALTASGVATQTGDGDGYSGFVANPQTAVAPQPVLETVLRWLADVTVEPAKPATGDPVTTTTLALDGALSEEPVEIPVPGGALAGIVTWPAAKAAGRCTVVLLNAGAVRRSGPGRLWVRAARTVAAQGVPAVRLDLLGIGDANGGEDRTGGDELFYTPDLLDQVRALLDGLVARGLPARFVLVGLCSGAYWAANVVPADDRVAAVLALNPRALVWEPWRAKVEAAHDVRRLRHAGTWRRVLTGSVSWPHARAVAHATLHRQVRRVVGGRSAQEHTGREMTRLLERINAGAAVTTVAFSAGEPLSDELHRLGILSDTARWPRVRWHTFVGPEETHTLPAREQQDEAVALVTALAAEAGGGA